MTKKKILWLSDSAFTTTGYSSQTRHILNFLKDDYECHQLAHNYLGQTLLPPIKFTDGQQIDFTMHGSGRAKYSMDIITNEIRKNSIDVFGILLDSFMAFESGFMGVDTSPARTFFYFPSDGGGRLPKGCEQILQKVDIPIAMSRFGRDQVMKVHGIKTEYIPHGIDTKLFYPLSKKRRALVRDTYLFHNKFVVGTVARNQGRKMMDRTVKAFALFCKDKPDAVLLMHCDPDDMAQTFSLSLLVSDLKLQNRVIFTGTSFHRPFTYTQMNDVYNAMDVFFLSTSGEGFGIPTVEAMACGVPQVVTDYTTTRELIEEDGRTGESVLLAGENKLCPHPHTSEVLDGAITGSWNVERGVMSIYDAVKKLNKLYYDRKLLKEYSVASVDKVKRLYSWDVIMPQWKKVLKKLVEL